MKLNRAKSVCSCTVILAAIAAPCYGSNLTKEELYIGVAEAREAIVEAGFKVSFTFERDGAEAADSLEHRHVTAAFHGEKLFMEDERDFGDGTGGLIASSFDGESSWRYQPFNTLAIKQAGPEHHVADTEGTGFFDLMAWYPCEQVRAGSPHVRDLLSVLSSPYAEVRSETETIGGRETHVVDLYSSFDGVLERTIWIDAERGYLPLLEKNYSKPEGQAPPEPSIILSTSVVMELAEGVWIPVEGTREGAGKYAEVPTYTMNVDAEEGEYAAEFDPDFDSGFFNYSNHLPPGATVYDKDADERWIVHGTDYRATGEAAFASLPKEIRDQFADRSVQAQRAWWIPPYDEPAWLAVTAVAGVLTIAAMRKFGG